MKNYIFPIIFLVFGLAAIYGCLHFALLPTNSFSMQLGFTPINRNAGMDTIAMAIIAVGCFIACAIMIRKN